VPAFKAGQAESTAGAGQRGNAVVMGHVSSLHSGDVFKNLEQVHLGDDVEVFSDERSFAYRVFETRSVARTDLAMVEPTAEPIVSLFTCTGVWDAVAWDYTERLFVRARLITTPGPK
jgi:sortase A